MRPRLGVSLLLSGALAGCGGGSPSCTYAPLLQVIPATATVSSTAKPPANQQVFQAALGETAIGTDCAVPAFEALVFSTWTNPDPAHISISSASDMTNGTAVCHGPTAGPVTLTATYLYGTKTVTATVQLTCD